MFEANAPNLKRWNSQSEGMSTKHVMNILRQNTVRGYRVLPVLASTKNLNWSQDPERNACAKGFEDVGHWSSCVGNIGYRP
jgi:hypothetical protein